MFFLKNNVYVSVLLFISLRMYAKAHTPLTPDHLLPNPSIITDQQKNVEYPKDIPAGLLGLFEKMEKEGFISTILWHEITGWWNMYYYGRGKYENLTVHLEKLLPYKDYLAKNPELFYRILEIYDRIDAGSSREQRIPHDAVTIIYGKVLHQFFEIIGSKLLDLTPQKIVLACPKSPYILDAVDHFYKHKNEPKKLEEFTLARTELLAPVSKL